MSKCKEAFENRANPTSGGAGGGARGGVGGVALFEYFVKLDNLVESKNGVLHNENGDLQKQSIATAKRKMLGNVKFIGK